MSQFSRKSITLWTAVLLFTSPAAFAEVLSTTGSFVVHEKDITQYIEDQTNALLVPNQVIVPTLNLTSPYKSTLTNISWQGNATLTWTKNSANNIWAFNGQTTGLTLYADTFSVNDTVNVNVGGNNISVQLNFTCQNLAMTMPGQWKVQGQIPMSWSGGQLLAPLQGLILTPSTQVPTITVGSCTGPAGVQQYLNQLVATQFANPVGMQASLQTELQVFINSQISKVTAMMNKPVSFNILGATVNFTPSLGQNLATGTWVLDGPLVLSAPNGTGNTTVPQGYSIANMADARASGFVFANTFWPQILGFANRAGLTTQTMASSAISAFQSFMANRFEQFFVWSDLMNFPTNQPFNFTFDSTSPITIQSQTNMSPGVQWNLTSPLFVEMDAVYSNATIPYAQFQSITPVGAQLYAHAVNGALNVTYSLTSLNMNYAFRKEFFKIRQPTFGIGMDAIDSAILSSETNQTWVYTLPDTASPLPGYNLLFSDLIFGTKTFRIEMGIQKQ
jgi:hypothetical protein